ncbi:chemotaxis protein CheB [Amaricoccus macauensis]|uniref:chemotaxis protein CheB n=1 Tax=Amaricoccus macauensis TaxID=57001 RepID=UPI003C7D4477
MHDDYSLPADLTDPKVSSADRGFHHVVAIGGSAGGVEALTELAPMFPRAFAAPIIIAVHSSPGSQLAPILDRMCPLPVISAVTDMQLKPAHVYVIPPHAQIRFEGSWIIVSQRKSSGLFRPSIDGLFLAMAEEFGDAGIGVVLSGAMDDGTLGARILHLVDARMIVQSPEQAGFSSMPLNVIAHDHPEAVLSLKGIAQKLVDIVGVKTSD